MRFKDSSITDQINKLTSSTHSPEKTIEPVLPSTTTFQPLVQELCTNFLPLLLTLTNDINQSNDPINSYNNNKTFESADNTLNDPITPAPARNNPVDIPSNPKFDSPISRTSSETSISSPEITQSPEKSASPGKSIRQKAKDHNINVTDPTSHPHNSEF